MGFFCVYFVAVPHSFKRINLITTEGLDAFHIPKGCSSGPKALPSAFPSQLSALIFL